MACCDLGAEGICACRIRLGNVRKVSREGRSLPLFCSHHELAVLMFCLMKGCMRLWERLFNGWALKSREKERQHAELSES